MNTSDDMTTNEAAREAGLSDASVVRHAIRNGTLPSTKRGRDNFIKREDFDRWRAEIQKRKTRKSSTT